MHAWHHGSQPGGAPEGAPVVAEWELIRCGDHHESQHRQQQNQRHGDQNDAGRRLLEVARPEDCEFCFLQRFENRSSVRHIDSCYGTK